MSSDNSNFNDNSDDGSARVKPKLIAAKGANGAKLPQVVRAAKGAKALAGKLRKSVLNTTPTESTRMHIRRCHICDQITETDELFVTHCQGCGKSMAPFYFFNEDEVCHFTDGELRPSLPLGERHPIRGLTAYW